MYTQNYISSVSLPAAGDGISHEDDQVSICFLFSTVMRCVVPGCVQKERECLAENGAVAT